MNRPPPPRTPDKGSDVIVRDFESLKFKWTGIFNFECPPHLKHFADDSAAALDQLIVNVGAENLRDSGIWQIALGEEMHVSSGTFYYSLHHRLAENTEYLAARMSTPPPASYARGAERTMVLPGAARREPEISPDDLFGPAKQKATPVSARRPAITEEDLFGTPAAPEVTRVVRQRGFPREWLGVDPNHNARATLTIGDWQGNFAVEAMGMTGCFLRTIPQQRYGNLAIQNDCLIELQIPGCAPFISRGNLTEINGHGTNTALAVYFRDVGPHSNEVLARLNAYLHGPVPAKSPESIRTHSRRAMQIVLGATGALALFAAGGAIYLTATGPKNMPDISDREPMPPLKSLKPQTQLTRYEIETACRISFVPERETYTGSTPLTRGEKLTTARLTFRRRSREAAKAGMHQADLGFVRERETCETKEPLFVKPGETQEIPCVLTCVEQPPK